MTIFKQVGKTLQYILNDYPEKAGKESGFIQRVRKVTGSLFIRTLLFAWMKNPNSTLDALTREGFFHHLQISPQGLDKRFNEKACDCIRTVLEEAVRQVITCTEPVDQALLQPFSSVYVHDSTNISLPNDLAGLWKGTGGSTATANQSTLKIDVMFEIKQGGIKGLDLLNGKHSDNKTPLLKQAVEVNSLHLKDLGYFNLKRMREQDERGEYWLSLLQPHTHVFLEGKKLNLGEHLQTLHEKKITTQEYSVKIGAEERLASRLFLVRRSDASADRQRVAVKKQAQDHGRMASKARLALCDWIILISNAPAEKMNIHAATTLYGARWQIELLFKLWKSQSKLAESVSKKPWRILCEIYTKLLIVIVQHWILLTGLWGIPSRSLTKGVQAIQEQAARLSFCLDHFKQLLEFLQQMADLFTTSAGCKQNKRRKKPNTWQRLQANLDFEGLS